MEKYTLVGVDGNAFCVLGYVSQAMKDCGYSTQEVNDYIDDATSSNYSHLLSVSYKQIAECNQHCSKDGGSDE